MKRQFAQLVVRVLLNAAGIYVAAWLLDGVSYQHSWSVLFIAAAVLALVNALIKPFIIILALPALLLTLGVFSIIINGFMINLVDVLYPAFEVHGFITAILAGIVIGLVNYILTAVFDNFQSKE